jgi:hypothetical protein
MGKPLSWFLAKWLQGEPRYICSQLQYFSSVKQQLITSRKGPTELKLFSFSSIGKLRAADMRAEAHSV